MWTSSSQAFSEVFPFGVDVDPDGLGDLGLIMKSGGNTALQWLRASQSAGVVTFVPTTPYTDSGLTWAPTLTEAY
jgi:hypothetical protein